ncbi:GNAT family N-acetyltransferase [Actinophytocola sp.]|uniref:GNAT family N-acetyltransferase n=1 Tax=Actinophytocola sp. TaxID=1872138 RepID=UPI0025BC670B|nr:GNAT family N-acetyltransferase [Actinophytocola sp.]
MYTVRRATPADLDVVIELIARLQADPAHLIAFHGESVEEVAEELAGLRPDWVSGAVVATDRTGRVRGVLSIEVDDELHRAYLYGPYVDVPANHPAAAQLWQATADALFDRADRLPRMAAVTMFDMFGHRRNRLLADFAARHDVAVDKSMRLFALTGADLRALLVRPAGRSPAEDRIGLMSADAEVRAAVAGLHDRCFPTAPTPGHRLVADGSVHTVVVLRDGASGVLGYAAGVTQADEYYVDMVGVDPAVRSLGAGRQLVRRLLVELATHTGARNRATALIRLGNDASERMFTALGFTLHTELVSYRKTDHHPAADLSVTQP